MKGNLTEGNAERKLIAYAIPVILGNIFQQLYNIADSVIVGRFLGKNALAAVGDCTSVTFLFVAIATGLSFGTSIVLSQIWGRRDFDLYHISVRTIIISVAVLSIILSVTGLSLNRSILTSMNTPYEIIEDAADYLSIYFMGLTFLFMFNVMNAIFQSMGNSRTPFLILTCSSVMNIGLDLLFVQRFSMGVSGVAYATLISQAFSAVVSSVLIYFTLKKTEGRKNKIFFDMNIFITVWKCAIPSIIQQSFISVCNMLVQVIINGFGAAVIAGYAAATKIDGLAGVSIINMGSAISTFTSQNLGAGKPERVEEAVKAGFKMIFVIGISIFLLTYIFGNELIGFFIGSKSEPEVLELGVMFLKGVSPIYFLLGTLNVYNGVIRGAGLMFKFLECSCVNMAIRVINVAVFSHFFGISSIQPTWAIGWTIGTYIAFKEYKRGRWKTNELIKNKKEDKYGSKSARGLYKRA